MSLSRKLFPEKMPDPPKGGLKRGAVCSERIRHAPCCGKDTKAAGWNDPAAAVRVANANAAIAWAVK
jgi:hypothetical protein